MSAARLLDLFVLARARGHREPARPNPGEAGLLGDFGREAGMRLHDEGERFIVRSMNFMA